MSAEEGNTGQATAPAPATKPAKDPKRVAAGKSAAQKTKEVREAQKKALADAEERAKKAEEKAARAAKKESAAPPNPVGRPAEEENPKSDSEGLNTTRWLTLGSIVVGLIGIYYKREELKAVADKIMGPKALPPPPAAENTQPGDCCPVCDGFWGLRRLGWEGRAPSQRLPADGIRAKPFHRSRRRHKVSHLNFLRALEYHVLQQACQSHSRRGDIDRVLGRHRLGLEKKWQMKISHRP